MVLTLFSCAGTGNKTTEKSLEYALNSGGKSYMVLGISTCTDSEIVIPSTNEGLPVTDIGAYSFYDNQSITSIKIPDSVTNIDGMHFLIVQI